MLLYSGSCYTEGCKRLHTVAGHLSEEYPKAAMSAACPHHSFTTSQTGSIQFLKRIVLNHAACRVTVWWWHLRYCHTSTLNIYRGNQWSQLLFRSHSTVTSNLTHAVQHGRTTIAFWAAMCWCFVIALFVYWGSVHVLLTCEAPTSCWFFYSYWNSHGLSGTSHVSTNLFKRKFTGNPHISWGR